jgi:hypothetical protein
MSQHSLPPSQWPMPPGWTVAAAVVVLVLLWLMGKALSRRMSWTGGQLAVYLTSVTCVWALVLVVGYWLWIREGR